MIRVKFRYGVGLTSGPGRGAAPGASTRRVAAAACALLAATACTADDGPPPQVPPVVTAPCREAVCDPISGVCAESFVVDGTACDDRDACTEGDRCVGGACVTRALDCDDGNPCTDDRCDPATGCAWVDNTTSCDDGDACTHGDVCRSGACVGAPLLCDDGTACTDDRCDPDVGCVFTPQTGLEAPCGGLDVQCPVGFVCQGSGRCVSCDGSEHFVAAGRFWMGCDPGRTPACSSDEQPEHRVVTGAYVIQPTEVTASAYAACVQAAACPEPRPTEAAYATYGVEGREQYPVTAVTWHDAAGYCAWLGAERDAPWRLCSEAEWEKAARGACSLYCERSDDDACCRVAMPTYPWGETEATCALAIMDEGDAGHNGCGQGTSAPVASRPDGMSPFGLFDMAGNVWEWVADCWHSDFAQAPSDGSTWADASCAGDMRVVRGGSFGQGAVDLRATTRTFFRADDAHEFFGFRCCRGID